MAPTYQDVVRANLPQVAWALVEAAGNDHAPYVGLTHLTSSGTRLYQQTGPFANSLSMHFAGNGGLSAVNPVVFQPPLTLEAWFKLDAASTAANRALMYYGNTGTNGFGMYIPSGSTHLTVLHGGVVTQDTAYVMDTNWHLIQLVQETTSVQSVYVDGILVSRTSIGAYAAPSTPLAFMFDSAGGEQVAGSISMPAVYPFALTGQAAYAPFLAATDPTSAMSITLSQGAAAGQTTSGQLQAILNAVTFVAH